MKVSIVIPAHNEENSISDVVKGCLPYGQVIVIDDGSSDKTAIIARKEGAAVIRHRLNRGYSAALRTGILLCKGDVVALMDADGQQPASELISMIEPIIRNRADMVIGSKIIGRMEYIPVKKNALINAWFARLIQARYGIRLTHPFSGMRAMRREYIDINALKGNHFEAVAELDISFAARGLRILEVPRVAKARKHGMTHVRNIDAFRIGKRTLEMLLIYHPAKIRNGQE